MLDASLFDLSAGYFCSRSRLVSSLSLYSFAPCCLLRFPAQGSCSSLTPLISLGDPFLVLMSSSISSPSASKRLCVETTPDDISEVLKAIQSHVSSVGDGCSKASSLLSSRVDKLDSDFSLLSSRVVDSEKAIVSLKDSDDQLHSSIQTCLSKISSLESIISKANDISSQPSIRSTLSWDRQIRPNVLCFSSSSLIDEEVASSAISEYLNGISILPSSYKVDWSKKLGHVSFHGLISLALPSIRKILSHSRNTPLVINDITIRIQEDSNPKSRRLGFCLRKLRDSIKSSLRDSALQVRLDYASFSVFIQSDHVVSLSWSNPNSPIRFGWNIPLADKHHLPRDTLYNEIQSYVTDDMSDLSSLLSSSDQLTWTSDL